MEFSIEKCWEIIFLYLHRLGPKLSTRAIAKELQCSRNTVEIWIHRYSIRKQEMCKMKKEEVEKKRLQKERI